jgi:pyridoxine 5-phosphate synthase
MPKLGVNIDHVATLRQARSEDEPNLIKAAQTCLDAGADSIVAHLREDRRHIQDQDLFALRKVVKNRFNIECSINKKIIAIVKRVHPDLVTLVPEKREEITTEGGINVLKLSSRIEKIVSFLHKSRIPVSLFIAPIRNQILQTKKIGAETIEIHTGQYANASTTLKREEELKKIKDMTAFAISLGLRVSAGHGLKYHNTRAIAAIPGMEELNIGHSIISRAVFIGLFKAVKEMKKIVSLK